MTIAILSTLCGAAMGLRFRFPALAPAMALGFVLIVGTGAIVGTDIARIAVDLLVAAVALQLGFLGGAGARTVTARARPLTDDHSPRAPC